MTTRTISTLTILLTLLPSVGTADEKNYLKAFPQAEEGMVRYVIELPHKTRQEEVNFQVELIVGKTIQTDGVNQYRIGGSLDSKPLEGWGFNYYELKQLGPISSTLIGVPPGTPKDIRFVHGPSMLINYNSRVPVVVYLPKGAELQYRIWSAPVATTKAKQM